jgi:hypothetical protein
MKLTALIALLVTAFGTAAHADCSDEACSAIQKILNARAGNFAKIKGKPGLDPRGDPVWEGTQPIAGLAAHCYIYRRGEGARYEYRCNSETSASPEQAKTAADAVKAAIQSVEPNIEWLEDPAVRNLADLDDFKGTQGWYGGFDKNKTVVVKVEAVASVAVGSTTIVTFFAKPITRKDLR